MGTQKSGSCVYGLIPATIYGWSARKAVVAGLRAALCFLRCWGVVMIMTSMDTLQRKVGLALRR